MGTKRILFAIFILALVLRLFAVFSQEEDKKIPMSDASNYDRIAMNIISGHGFSEDIEGKKILTTRRTPVYPLFLSGIYLIFGHSYLAVKVVQAVIGALFCIVIFFITSTVYNNKVGVIASFITAIYKPFVSGFFYYGGPAYLISEYLYMFFIGLSILTSILFIKKGDKRFAVLSGVFIGTTILIRPEFVIFLVLLFFYLFYASRFSIKEVFRKYFVIGLFIILTLTPWIVRNYIVEGKFIPLTTYGGYMFWMGNNSLANGGWAFPPDYKEIKAEIRDIPEYEKNKIFFKKGIEDLRADLKRVPRLFVKKALVHWAPFEEGFKIFNPYYAFILLFGSIGILFFRKRDITENIILIVFLTTTITAVIIFGDPRYRYPYEFYLIIFAAVAIDKIFGMIQKSLSLKV